MTITQTQDGNKTTLSVEGRLDTITAPELEKQILSLSDTDTLVIDCSKLEYISSAGLRVLLSAHKAYEQKGGMTVSGAGDMVLDVFEVTGFRDILNIQ